jgi:hypothetical protein
MEGKINYKEVLEIYANQLIGLMKKNLIAAMLNRQREARGGVVVPPTSELEKSIIVDVGSNYVLITMDYYGRFINEGVRGNESSYDNARNSPYSFKSKMPPTSVFSGKTGWIAQKGLIDRGDIRRKTGAKTKKQLNKAMIEANKSLAWRIAKSIQKKGIPGYHFIDAALQSDLLEKIVDVLAEHTKKEIIVKIA